MGIRTLSAAIVVLSLTAPPLVGVVCAWMCAGHAHHGTAAAAHHAGHVHGATHQYGGDTGPAVVLVAAHPGCAHELGIVELFSPSGDHRAPAPQASPALPVAAVPQVLQAGCQAGVWSPPDDGNLPPPRRSSVLRI